MYLVLDNKSAIGVHPIRALLLCSYPQFTAGNSVVPTPSFTVPATATAITMCTMAIVVAAIMADNPSVIVSGTSLWWSYYIVGRIGYSRVGDLSFDDYLRI